MRRTTTPLHGLVGLIAAAILASCGAASSSPSTTTITSRTSSTVQVTGTVAIPNVAGKAMDQAVRTVQAAGLQPGGIQVNPTGPKTSVVLSTSPPAGTRVARGSRVIFNIGSGN